MDGVDEVNGLMSSALSTSSTLSTPSTLSRSNFPRPFGHVIGVARAPCDRRGATCVIARPDRLAALAQEILVVEAQLLQAGACYIRQLELHLFRGAAGLTTLGDVLDAAARGLNHLIVGAAAFGDVSVAEPDRYVIDKLRDLKALKSPVTAMLRNQRVACIH